MYSSSTSSSPQGSMGSSGGGGGGGGNGNGNGNGGGLMRYGSAPSSILNSAVDSVIGATREFSALGAPNHHNPTAHFFPSESAAMANQNDVASRRNSREELGKLTANTTIGLQPSYGFVGGGGGGGGSSSLARHSSSPAGFLNQLASVAAVENNNGFSITRGIGSYNAKGVAESGRSRLNPQLSFTGQQPPSAASLSRISEDHNNAGPSDNDRRKCSRSYSAASGSGSGSGGGYGALGSWDQTHPIIFSVAQPNGAHNIDSQFHFSMSQEMASMDKLLNIPQDSVTCKIRAKRGFATHPRSIAERERRTRISGKLKKLQDLVPNMDKQTSYADMLDLAVQHIKTLQNQVQKLHTELDSCTCGCKKTRDS